MKNRVVSTVSVVAVIGLCAVAMLISNDLLKVHGGSAAQGTAFEGSWWSQFCGEDDGGGGGCQSVVASRHGTLNVPGFGAVPVALLGQWFYTFIGVWFLFVGAPQRSKRMWHLVPLVLAFVASGVSAYYIYIMSSELHEWCTLCLVLHSIDFVLVGLILLMWLFPLTPGSVIEPDGLEPDPGDRADSRFAVPVERLVFSTLACILACCFVSYLWFGFSLRVMNHAKSTEKYQQLLKSMSEDRAVVFGTFLGSIPVEVPQRSDAPQLGPTEAKHELVIFSDLQCSSCRAFEYTLREQVMPSLGERLRVVFRHFPLCTDCNPSQTPSGRHRRGIHPQACQASYAAEAARMQGGNNAFWEMHDLVFSRQQELFKPEFSPLSFEIYAQELGLDVERFRADMSGDHVRQIVKGDVDAGVALGVRGTPTVFLDGKRIRPIQRGSDVFWQSIIADFLKAEPVPAPGDQQG